MQDLDTGIISDFCQLILYPDIREKVSILFRIMGIELTGSKISSKISSAYKNNLCSVPPPHTPLVPVSALRATANGSRNMVKSSGVSRSPCFRPLYPFYETLTKSKHPQCIKKLRQFYSVVLLIHFFCVQRERCSGRICITTCPHKMQQPPNII